MQLSETAANILLGVLIFILLGANVYFRKRKSDQSPMGMVVGIFTDINRSLKQLESFSFHWQMPRLRMKNWQRHKNKLDFLPQELRSNLDMTFEIVAEVNQRIDSAKKHKSDSYMAGIEISKLKEPLEKSKQRVQEWVRENMQNPEYLPKRRGLFR